MSAPNTALYAGLLALLVIVLSVRISRMRLAYRVGIGDGGHKDLARAMRVQANALEYIPLGLLLILVAELNAFPVWSLHAAGSGLFLGRVLHAAGLGRSVNTSPERFTGITLTWLVIASLAVALLVDALL